MGRPFGRLIHFCKLEQVLGTRALIVPMAALTPLLFFIFCVTKVVSQCPPTMEGKSKLCVTDTAKMLEECPQFYCGEGRTCDKTKPDPHDDCRAHKSDITSGYCFSGPLGYICNEVNDGKVPSPYVNGVCQSDGLSLGLCGQNTCPAVQKHGIQNLAI